MELESDLRAQGMEAEEIAELCYGDEQESEGTESNEANSEGVESSPESQTQESPESPALESSSEILEKQARAKEQKQKREKAYNLAKLKHLKALNPTKAIKAIKAYTLLTTYQNEIAHIDRSLNANLTEVLQRYYLDAHTEVLAHRVFLQESSDYAKAIHEQALSLWVEFRMTPMFKDAFYRSTRGVSLKVILDIEKIGDFYYLSYAQQWQNVIWESDRDGNPEKPLANEIYQAQRRVWSNHDTTLWKITHQHRHDNIYYYKNRETLQPLETFLQDTNGAEVFSQEIARFEQSLRAKGYLD